MNARERVSCCMDDELSADEHMAVSRVVLDDPELSAVWARYQRVRRLLQHDTTPDVSDVAARVQQALAAEPTVFAPVAQRLQRAPRRRWQMAFAASVALLAIGLVPQWMFVEAPDQALLPPAYLNRYLSEHHAYLGASHVTQPNAGGALMAVHHVP